MTSHLRTTARYGSVIALAATLLMPQAALAAPDNTAVVEAPAAEQAEPNAVPATFAAEQTGQVPADAAQGEPEATISTEKIKEGKLIVRGTGYTSKTAGRGAVFAVKFNDAPLKAGNQGAENPVPGGHPPNSPAHYIGVAKEDGTFEAEVPLPTKENSDITDDWFKDGAEHSITVLSGSLGEWENGNKAKPMDARSSNEISFKMEAAKNDDKPTPPKDENDQSGWTELKAPATDGKGSEGVMRIKPYKPGQKLRIAGSGWTNAAGNGASTVAIKLDHLKDGKPAQYSRSDNAINDYLKSHGKAADPTSWVLLVPEKDKANPAQGVYALNEDGSFDIEIDPPEGLLNGKKGDYLTVSAQTGRNADGDVQRSATSKPVPVDGQAAQEYKEPQNNEECKPENGDFTPKLKIENPNVAPGEKLHITGTGWCNPGDKRVSEIGLKIDDGQVSRKVAVEGSRGNRTTWAVVKPDPKTGNIDMELELPNEGNMDLPSDPAKRKELIDKYNKGQHTLRLLTGTLRKGDRSGTYGGPDSDGGINTTFVIGKYEPNADPKGVAASQLGEGERNGVEASLDGNQMTVKVPNSAPGTWVKVTPYLDDSPQLVRASKWLQLGDNRQVSYDMGGSLPPSDYRVVVQSGNQDEYSKVLGWDNLTVPEPTDPDNSGGNNNDTGQSGQQDQGSQDSGDTGGSYSTGGGGSSGSSSGSSSSRSRSGGSSGGSYSNPATGSAGSSRGVTTVKRSSSTPAKKSSKSSKSGSSKSSRTPSSSKGLTAGKSSSAKTPTSKTTKANNKTTKPNTIKAKANPVNQKKNTNQAKKNNSKSGNATGTEAQAEGKVVGTELSGIHKWLVNNANNILLTLSGIVLVGAAVLYKRKKNPLEGPKM